MECPSCEGKGVVTIFARRVPISLEDALDKITHTCGRCGGKGKLSVGNDRAIEQADRDLAEAEDNRLFGRDTGW